MIAITSESPNMQGELDLVWEHLLPAMKDKPLPSDPQSVARLRQTLSSLALSRPRGQSTSPTAGRVSEKTFKLEANDLGFQTAVLGFGDDTCRFTLQDAQGEHSIACGLGAWRRGETALPGTPPRLVSGGAPPRGTLSKVAATGAWKDENTFEMLWRFYETPHHDTVTCRFDGPKVTIAFMNSIAAMSPTPKDKRPALLGYTS